MNYNDNDYDDFYEVNSTDESPKEVKEEVKQSNNSEGGFSFLCILELLIILVIVGYSVFSASSYYDVIFVDNDEIIAKKRVLKNHAMDIPDDITKEGYIVSKYICTYGECDFSEPIITDTLIKVEWETDPGYEKKDNEVIVTFKTDGGSIISPSKITIGSKVKKPANPTKEGYIFVEWLLNGEKFDFNNSISSDITLVARYKKKDIHSGNVSGNVEGSNYKNYTIMVNVVDNESDECYLTIYENGYAIDIKNITYYDGVKFSASIKGNKVTVKRSDIEDEKYFKVTLKTGEVVTAEIK